MLNEAYNWLFQNYPALAVWLLANEPAVIVGAFVAFAFAAGLLATPTINKASYVYHALREELHRRRLTQSTKKRLLAKKRDKEAKERQVTLERIMKLQAEARIRLEDAIGEILTDLKAEHLLTSEEEDKINETFADLLESRDLINPRVSNEEPKKEEPKPEPTVKEPVKPEPVKTVKAPEVKAEPKVNPGTPSTISEVKNLPPKWSTMSNNAKKGWLKQNGLAHLLHTDWREKNKTATAPAAPVAPVTAPTTKPEQPKAPPVKVQQAPPVAPKPVKTDEVDPLDDFEPSFEKAAA